MDTIDLYKSRRIGFDKKEGIKQTILYHSIGGPYVEDCHSIHEFAPRLASAFVNYDFGGEYIKFNVSHGKTFNRDGLEMIVTEPLNSEELGIVAAHLVESITKSGKIKKEKE